MLCLAALRCGRCARSLQLAAGFGASRLLAAPEFVAQRDQRGACSLQRAGSCSLAATTGTSKVGTLQALLCHTGQVRQAHSTCRVARGGRRAGGGAVAVLRGAG